MSGLVLLLKVWGGRRGGSVGTDKEMEDVHKCMNVLKQCEPKYVSMEGFSSSVADHLP
jgi:hypothetical protein